MSQMGWQEMTVAELISRLAGLPPMMEVYALADDVSMFVNDVQVEQSPVNTITDIQSPPFLRLVCNQKPKTPEAPTPETVEEQTARQAQRSMEMAHNIQGAMDMPRRVE